MRKARILTAALMLVCATWAGAWRPREMPCVPGEIVVQYRSGATARASEGFDRAARGDAARAARPASLRALDTKYGLVRSRRVMDAQVDERLRARVRGRDESLNLSVLPPPASNLSPPKRALHRLSALAVLTFDGDAPVDEICAAYRADPNVVAAEPNWIGTLFAVPGDPLYPQQASDLSHIGIEAAWDIQTGSPSVRVAIIDGGVDTTHVDLQGAIDPAGYNFVDNNTNIYDDLDHGTRIAGIIGAVGNNNDGIAGVAYGVQLLVLDVADSSGTIALAHAIAAVDYAVAQGADVINMSFGFYAKSSLFEQACRNARAAGTVLVASAGNENQSTSLVYPAGFDSVIGVAALDSDSTATERAVFSNYNAGDLDLVDLAAPGSTIFSTVAGSIYDGSMGSGTSFASAIVSGVAALLKSRYRTQSPAGIRNLLLATAEPVGVWAGSGLVNAGAALTSQATPLFSVVSVRVDDDTGLAATNDGDGHLELGEIVTLHVTLRNTGLDATSVSATLSTTDPTITIADAAAAWGDIAADKEKENATNDAFTTLGVSMGSPTHRAAMRLDVSTGDGATTHVVLFELPIERTHTPPAIIGADTTWTQDNTYVIDRNTVVMPAATLTIEPGTLVRLGRNGRIEVRGGIDAPGGEARNWEENGSVFTSLNDRPGGGFETPRRFAVGRKPDTVAIADFDNDGNNDIFAIHYLGSEASFIRWGGSDFQPTTAVAVGKYATTFAYGDLDNDGDNDIVTATGLKDYQTLVYWNGTSFDPPVELNTGLETNDVAIGDADNDGDMDILVSDQVADEVVVFFQTPAGFVAGARLPTGEDPTTIVVADVDDDGDNDITVRNNGSWDLSVIRWSGSGFDPEIRLSFGTRARGIAVGDANNDGANEILTANISADSVFMVQWNGTGFDPPVEMAVGSEPASIRVEDVDNDGDNDILVTHIRSHDLSLIRWNGGGFDPEMRFAKREAYLHFAVGDADNDGYNDIVLTNHGNEGEIRFLRFDPGLSQLSAHGGLWIRDTAHTADFQSCHILYGPVRDESSVGSFTDCAVQAAGAHAALSTVSGTSPVVRCLAFDNGGGDGIVAGTKKLTGCVGQNNAGRGLVGGHIEGCNAYGNRSGIVAAGIVTGCTAMDNESTGILASEAVFAGVAVRNGTWGIASSGDDSFSWAFGNTNGIRAGNVTSSTAAGNAEIGISARETARLCVAAGNGGQGLLSRDFINCIVSDNGRGVAVAGMMTGCFVAENDGPGVSGGVISNSLIRANKARGVDVPDRIENCWIMANLGTGIQGRAGPNYSVISSNTIVGNVGSGVRDAGSVNACNLHDNGRATGADYEESRPTTELAQVDVTGNYWGPETTALMNDHPWGTYFDIPKIHDFVDNTTLAEARYEGHLQQPASVPDDRTPAFLISVQPDLLEPASIGKTTFTLTFSKAMNTMILPAVTFGTTTPYTARVVLPDPGWVTPTIWRGKYAISVETGAGIHTIRVSQATDPTGFVIPDDTSHQFEITWGSQHANVGLATAIGSNAIRCTWDPSTRSDLLGYNILRSPTGLPGTYARVNTSLVVTDQFIDTGLESETTYYYIVYEVDDGLNATQLTPPFQGTTIGQGADLTIRGFDFWPDQVDGGETIHFVGTVTNDGHQPTGGGSFEIRFEVSARLDFEAPRFTLCDPYRVTDTLQTGGAFDLATVSATVRTVAQGLPEGAYTVGIIVDPLHEVPEERLDNNVTWVSRGKKTLYVGERPTRADRWMLYR